MSSKSMSGMFCANHRAIGFRSKRFNELSRNRVIHDGSDLWCQISSTTSSLSPFLGLYTNASPSFQPSLYVPRSIPQTRVSVTDIERLLERRRVRSVRVLGQGRIARSASYPNVPRRPDAN